MSSLYILTTQPDGPLGVLPHINDRELRFNHRAFHESRCFAALGVQEHSLLLLAPKLYQLPFQIGVIASTHTVASVDDIANHELGVLFDRFCARYRSANIRVVGEVSWPILSKRVCDIWYGAVEGAFVVGVSAYGMWPTDGDFATFRLEFYRRVLSILNLSQEVQLHRKPLKQSSNDDCDVDVKSCVPWEVKIPHGISYEGASSMTIRGFGSCEEAQTKALALMHEFGMSVAHCRLKWFLRTPEGCKAYDEFRDAFNRFGIGWRVNLRGSLTDDAIKVFEQGSVTSHTPSRIPAFQWWTGEPWRETEPERGIFTHVDIVITPDRQVHLEAISEHSDLECLIHQLRHIAPAFEFHPISMERWMEDHNSATR